MRRRCTQFGYLLDVYSAAADASLNYAIFGGFGGRTWPHNRPQQG